jgi:hypothetical protein
MSVPVSDEITVIPVSAAALAQVTTPFVTFEHPHRVRTGSLERQLEAMDRYGAVIVLGDTWPDSFHDQVHWERTRKIIKQYDEPQERWSDVVWPETAVYALGVARMLGVNEKVTYRPQLWIFSQFFEKCNKSWDEDIDILPEGTLYADNRCIYPVHYPKLALQDEQCELTVIVFGAAADEVVGLQVEGDVEVIGIGNEASGLWFNAAMEQAHGKYVAVCRGGDIVHPDRFDLQLAAAADLSLSSVIGCDRPWSLRGYTHRADLPTEQLSTLMFRRDIFRRIPGACPDLQTGFEYDLFVRIASDQSMTVAYLAEPLVERPLHLPFGRVYTQQVYNDAVNRVRYTKDYHAPSIRRRPLV